jgi:hypothetical protein
MQGGYWWLGVHRIGNCHTRGGSKLDQARVDTSETDCSDAVGLADAEEERHTGSKGHQGQVQSTKVLTAVTGMRVSRALVCFLDSLLDDRAQKPLEITKNFALLREAHQLRATAQHSQLFTSTGFFVSIVDGVDLDRPRMTIKNINKLI